MRLLLPLLLLAALPAAAETVTATRLVVTDHAAPTVRILAENGAELLRVTAAEPVRLQDGLHRG